jgi:thiol-disulfide isomerase/thioredoxin
MIINSWFSSCGPCKTELKYFGVVHGELGDKIRFIGVNPSQDSPELNVSFAADRGVHYELYREPDGAYSSAVGIQAYPVTLFVSADGTIVRQTGVLDEDELREYATELLG